ncbi:MAG: acyl-CoA dehydrogenase family protein, partial [Nocardioides sp.]
AVLLTAGLVEEPGIAVERPQTVGHGRRGGYRLTGTKVAVPALPHADAVLVPAFTDDGTLLFLIHTDDLGVTITPQLLSDGNAVGLLELDAVPVGPERLVGTSSGAATARLLDLAILALCAEQVGVCTGALRATAEYAAAYGQSDQPTGGLPGSQTSQARLADGYIDALCLESAMWQAAWLLDEGRPAAAELATAKFWAAEAGHRIAHTAMHLHGSQGVEPTGTAHRWFTAAKRIEFSLGSATEHALALGKLRLPTRPPGPSRGR